MFAPSPADVEAAYTFACECQAALGVFVAPDETVELFEAIHRALRACPASIGALYMSVAAVTIAGFGRQILRQSQRPLVRDFGASCSTRERVLQALERILAWHATPSLTLHEIADSLNVGPAYLSDSINRISGRGFLDHLHAIRILHATVDLTETDDSVAVIARRVGYCCGPQLVRSFHHILHLTPGRFRRVVQEKVPACSKFQRNSR